MDENISIMNSNTRNEKVRNFFIKNKVKIIRILLTTVIVLIGAYSFDKYKTNQKIYKTTQSHNVSKIYT